MRPEVPGKPSVVVWESNSVLTRNGPEKMSTTSVVAGGRESNCAQAKIIHQGDTDNTEFWFPNHREPSHCQPQA
jgi:hypothetical protein